MRSFLAPFTVTICPWRDWVQKEKAREEISLQAQSVKKVEVQEALPSAGVIGTEPLTLVPQHFPRKPA